MRRTPSDMSETPNYGAEAPSVLFLQGGWTGHKPDVVVALFAAELRRRGWRIEVSTTLDVLEDAERMKTYSLIFPCWTMGQLTGPQQKALVAAVHGGVGLAGVHGGMGDAFRGCIEYEWMCGGLFAGHPHVGDYTVRVLRPEHPLTAGMPAAFSYHSEQYYMLVDPAIEVLADTVYRHEGRSCVMPVAWTKNWGSGRVFYCALGHDPAEFEKHPYVRDLVVRGALWAARRS